MFGDEFDFKFWTVALHYLRRSVIFRKQKNESPQNELEDKDLFIPTPNRVVQTSDLLKLEDDNRGSILVDEIADESLESSFDILADRITFKVSWTNIFSVYYIYFHFMILLEKGASKGIPTRPEAINRGAHKNLC